MAERASLRVSINFTGVITRTDDVMLQMTEFKSQFARGSESRNFTRNEGPRSDQDVRLSMPAIVQRLSRYRRIYQCRRRLPTPEQMPAAVNTCSSGYCQFRPQTVLQFHQ